jgi:hypothetical protein
VNQKEEGGKKQVRKKGRGNIKTKHVKSLDRTGIRCQIEKTKRLMKIRPAE